MILSEDFSLHYAIINHAIALVKPAGKWSWLSKADITSPFKVLLIHPDFWRFAFAGEGYITSQSDLPSGARAAPSSLTACQKPSAGSWLTTTKFHFSFTSWMIFSSFPLRHHHLLPGLDTLMSVFSDLGVPLSAEKIKGLSTSLKFLGITSAQTHFKPHSP